MNNLIVEDAGNKLISDFTSKLESATKDGQRALFLMPGGSAAPLAVAIWNNLSPGCKENVIVSLTDERFGNDNHPDSNWRILSELGADLSSPRHLPVLCGLPDITETTQNWTKRLLEAVDSCNTKIALFGIGTDHHIAGIKPNSPVTNETDSIAANYQAEDFFRITISPLFFSHITDAAIYCEGSAKKDVVESLAKEREFHNYPDELIKRCGSFMVYYQA